MAPPSPRRSSRARPTNTQSQHSSASSGSSARGDRNTRSVVKPPSGKSTPSASLSSEPPEDIDDTLLGRRRTRGQQEEQDKLADSRPDILDMANGSDDPQDEEDEAVRCICGNDEYPGRPPVDSPDADIFAAVELTEDVTGFFVQCDVCKVWQHGACVGIFSAESSPDEYFCELCRKELHKIHTATNGQRFSKYLPLYRPSRATSRATSLVKDGTRSPKGNGSKSSRQNSASQSSKRRSTMNSRDAAYDDEQLRRAIEASKEETVQDSIESTSRRTKRGRSDSEENILHVKRQRTSSRSASPPTVPEHNEPPSRPESEDEANSRNGLKKLRNGRTHREKSEREDRERQRQEAANKRKGRAERRRADDSDLSEEAALAAAKPQRNKSAEPPSISEPPTPLLPPPGTPPPLQVGAGSTHKRGGRSNHKKGKGKNQYTKDREMDKDESPVRSMSRDIQKNTDEPTTSGHTKALVSEPKQTSKAKSNVAAKMSMADMKRRVAAIMDFISRTQVDLAAEASPPSQNGQGNSGQATPLKAASTPVNGTSGTDSHPDGSSADPPADKDFKDLNCMEMMDILTRDMVKWQNQYV